MAKKRILIPGGNLADWALVNAAHKLGLYVITSGTDKSGPAHKFSDEYVCADYSDKEAMLRLAEEKRIDYMCSNANDFGMISTAYVCEKLGLPGHDSYETTLMLHTKDRLKPLFKRLGIHSPVTEIFDDRDEALCFLRNANQRMIVKPADNVGSYGVSSPTTRQEMTESIDFAFSKSKAGRIVIEPFIDGFYTNASVMIIGEEVKAFFSRSQFQYPEGKQKSNVSPFPYYENTTGILQPALYEEDFAQKIISDFNKLARELHLVDGKFQCEMMITPEHEPYIFDVHRRMSGLMQPWSDWDITDEIHWEEWIVRAECGMDLSGFPVGFRQKQHFHIRNIFAPKDGILRRAVFDEYLTRHIYPHYEGKELILHDLYIKDHVHEPLFECLGQAGRIMLYFAFDNKEEAARIANPENNEFYAHVRFEYADARIDV